MSDARVRIAQEFVEGLSRIYSDHVTEQIYTIIKGLENMPLMGSADVRPCLVQRFEPNIREIAISRFIIIYRYENNIVDVLALEYGPTVS